MDLKDKQRLYKLGMTIKNSKEKISDYQSKINKEKDSRKRQILELKKEIEQLRVEMKNCEGKIIMLNNK